MKIKGWVYVISNPAMPGIIKVGYSTKDPALRARELNNTGSPHPYSVQYDTLVWDPYKLEQRVHKMLHSKLEGKEWFKCTIEEAIAAIQSLYGACFIDENFLGVERNSTQPIPTVEADPVAAVPKPTVELVEIMVLGTMEEELEAHKRVMEQLDKEVRGAGPWRTLPK